ncbi:MAG TPA: SDR family oxidoreductase [Arachidicoccus sp.]|nr:SDR family oxidoreductase [Arachidicoccus sp.]
MNKILVTGATGHLGKATIEHLIKNTAAENIVAFARDIEKAKVLVEIGIEVRIGNFDNPPALDHAMEGIDKLLLISGVEMNRVQQHKNVVDAAKKAGVRHIVYTSIPLRDIDNSAVKILMESHFQTEDYIKESGLTYTFLRNSLYADVIPIYVGEKVFETGIYYPAGNGKVAFALRREMGEAAANVLLQDGHGNKTYEITGGELNSFEDIARDLSLLSGKTVRYTNADAGAFSDKLKESGIPEDFVFILGGFASDIKNRQYEILSPDLENLLGREPASLEDSLKEIYTNV